MNQSLPSLDELMDAPELAVLHVLSTTLDAAEQALIASHPGLEFAAFGSSMPRADISMYLAEAILNHLASLKLALDRYGTHVRHASDVRQLGPGL